MQRDKVDNELQDLAFNFFYWFSRFEFALKENGYLKSGAGNRPAQPCWNSFIDKKETNYTLSRAGSDLITAAPKKQIVTTKGLCFAGLKFNNKTSELKKVVNHLKTVRNNLFHGGKHTAEGWDDPKRTKELLKLGIENLHELAKLGDIENDFKCEY